MEAWQKDLILKSRDKLIPATVCSTLFLNIFLSKEILSVEDLQTIGAKERNGGQYQAAAEFYDKVALRVNAFTILLEALKETRQSGALKILNPSLENQQSVSSLPQNASESDHETGPLKEMNILLLGETGTGKSKWINAFFNYVTYDSLKDAEAGDLCTLVPSEFTTYDKNFERIRVCTGIDKNEVYKIGQLTTQNPLVYPFVFGNTKIRLIDTPGVGSTQGIDQDRENFQNVLCTLSKLEEIHGICIFLKPYRAGLTFMFHFCITELLTYFPNDASKNMVFCFTNSRGTCYRPGDTMPALVYLLQELKDVKIGLSRDTVYYFDSETYRFLAAAKNDPPVSFGESEKPNFYKSWDKSTQETKRMLKFFSSIEPHPVKNTLNLNTTRELIVSLKRPLKEISMSIQEKKVLYSTQ